MKRIGEMPKGTPLRMYKTRNNIRAYKTEWSRKTGHRRILKRLQAKVTPTSVGAVVKSHVLAIKMTLVRLGHYFWDRKIYQLVHRCQAAPHKCLPSWRRECIRQYKRNRAHVAEMQNVPSGWDLYD